MYKFTVSKEYTTVAKVPMVKNAQKELKAMFTEKDLLEMFNGTFGHLISGQILETRVEGFNSNNFSDDVSLYVTMFIYDEYFAFTHISFYIDYEAVSESFAVVTRDSEILVNVRRYTRDC